MAQSCLLYYITDRTAFSGDESSRRRRLLEKIAEAARAGVDYIQLREKDLASRELESLGREAVRVVREARKLASGNRKPETAILINSRTDVVLAVQAEGVHLRSDDISPREVRQIWKCGGSALDPLIGASCHSPAEVDQAAANGATFAVFAPVFEKKDIPTTQPVGLAMLQQACRTNIPILALGGITLSNARSCLEAGAAGIAAIRLFQEINIAEVVQHLRNSS